MQSTIWQLTLGISVLFLSPFLAQAKGDVKSATSKSTACTAGLVKVVKLSKECGGEDVKFSFLRLPDDTYQVETCIPRLKVDLNPEQVFKAGNIKFNMIHANDKDARDLADIHREGRKSTVLHFPADHTQVVIRTLGLIETKIKNGGATEDCNLFINYLGVKDHKVTIKSTAIKTVEFDSAQIPSSTNSEITGADAKGNQ